MKAVGWVFALVLASACSEEGGSSSASTDDDAVSGTFTVFVIDLIENHTNDTEQPVAFEMFASLPDPDVENLDAYVALF